ncbi:MAG: membrane protein insertion efficiency factor YidD [Clostridia bacterium]|nr:membrane protein insertion efficiency factor YidD [Clostridia bacterium]MBQ8339181.1 membrane protein insertion efficiency factor YidD [Clostridia bacterium]MBQ8911704.1 membrane protein insertion efficiency factor YidD [Clostridia bacterium]
MKHLCIWLIRFYRRYLSPLKGKPSCRFVPTCSAYAIEAFQKRGFFVGMILTVWRILRCNPYCAGGYDPVPEKGLRYKGSRVIPMPTQDDIQPPRPDEDAASVSNGKEKKQ